MGLRIYTHKDCLNSALIQSAYCVEMSQAQDAPVFKQYGIPSTVMAATDVATVLIGLKTGGVFSTVPVPKTDWSVLSAQVIRIDPLPDGTADLHNRVIFVPLRAFNLCFTGAVGVNVMSKRPAWIKRDSVTYMYDYLALTSFDYYGPFTNIQQFPGITFVNGVGSGFVNLSSDYVGMRIDFDGQSAGTVVEVTGAGTLTVDSIFTSEGTSRAFLYKQGTLEFALDSAGLPGTWQRRLQLPVIDTDAALPVWVRDFKNVTQTLQTIPNYSLRLLGTEFII